MGLDVRIHNSYLKCTDTVIHKFARVLGTMDDEDQGVKFARIFRGLLSLLHPQDIYLSYAGAIS